MKIMLVCAGGMSTGILMQKMEKYGVDNGIELSVKAFGINDYEANIDSFDVVLLGPQISYKYDEMKAEIELPIGLIPALDYAMGNVENIMKLAQGL